MRNLRYTAVIVFIAVSSLFGTSSLMNCINDTTPFNIVSTGISIILPGLVLACLLAKQSWKKQGRRNIS